MATVSPIQPTIKPRRPPRTLPLHRITVDEYERITAAGALEDPGRIELIDGYMVRARPVSPPARGARDAGDPDRSNRMTFRKARSSRSTEWTTAMDLPDLFDGSASG